MACALVTWVQIADALSLPGQRGPSRAAPVAIYALHGTDGGVRYVGMTRGTLKARLAWHRRQPTNAAMAAWLSSGTVRAVALEYVPKHEWEEAERGWIYWFRQRGTLLNVDPGGAFRIDGKPRRLVVGEFIEPHRRECIGKKIPHANEPASSLWRRLYNPMGLIGGANE